MRGAFYVFFISLLFLNSLEYLSRPSTPDNLHFQAWTGDYMMQTLDSAVLKKHPAMSLIYLHIEPPMLDAIRAAATLMYPDAQGKNLTDKVDATVYLVWSVFFSTMAVLVYLWIRRLCNEKIAILSAFLWVINPSPIFYATLLESTLLGSLLILWFFYEMWLIGRGEGSAYRLGLASSLMFYTRSFFQWFFFPIVVVSLALLGASRRETRIYLVIVAVLITPLLIKQYAVFGLLETSTFNGYHKCGVIWYYPSKAETAELFNKASGNYPPDAKIYSPDEFNSQKQYGEHVAYGSVCNNWLIKHPITGLEGLEKSFFYNSGIYWIPSSLRPLNHAVNYLPWRDWFLAVFSKSTFPLIMLAMLGLWALDKRKNQTLLLHGRKSLGMALPLLYILLLSHLCNRYEWSEAQRMKFFLEPIFYIFIITQLCAALKNAHEPAKKLIQRVKKNI